MSLSDFDNLKLEFRLKGSPSARETVGEGLNNIAIGVYHSIPLPALAAVLQVRHSNWQPIASAVSEAGHRNRTWSSVVERR